MTAAHHPPGRPIRVLICDDHFVVRDGVRSRLERGTGFEVVGEAEEGAEAVELARRLEPDVVLMDLSMPPGMDGVEATRGIKAKLPQVKVLVLTTYDDDERILAAFAEGAAGYLLKDRSRQELRGAVTEVMAGGAPVDPRVNARLIRYLSAEGNGAPSQPRPRPVGSLTRREFEMLALAVGGFENKEIAQRLHVTHSNVKWHFNNIYKKLGVHHRAAAVLTAIDSGILNRDT